MRDVAVGAGLAVALFLAAAGVNIFPAIFLGTLLFVLWQTAGLRTAGRRYADISRGAKPPAVSFDDVGGQDVAKRELLEALDFLTDRDRAQRLGIRPLRGILLTGPPGTGKTLLAKAAARHTGSAFLNAAGSEFIEVYAGVGAQRVRQVFSQAREAARRAEGKSAILFIDEIEVLGGRRGAHQSHLEYDQTLNQLLVEMDGLRPDAETRILLIGATNRFDLLDPALLRPGRFDRIVRVELPDRAGRRQILELHTREKPLDPAVDLDALAAETFGFSGAHLESLTNEAAILAFREGSATITPAHFHEALDKVMLGERLDRRPTREELKRVAVHEAGHALVGELRRPGSVATVTVSPRGGALGYVRRSPGDDRVLFSQAELEAALDICLAGWLAELELLGEASTGTASDFEQAVRLARTMVLAGMSPLGVVDPDLLPPGTMHRAIGAIVDRRAEVVRQLLRSQRDTLHILSHRLLAQERLDGDTVRGLIATGAASSPGEVVAGPGGHPGAGRRDTPEATGNASA